MYQGRYPNVVYLFRAFAVSEKIHAENYKRILISLSAGLEEPELEILISDPKIRPQRGRP